MGKDHILTTPIGIRIGCVVEWFCPMNMHKYVKLWFLAKDMSVFWSVALWSTCRQGGHNVFWIRLTALSHHFLVQIPSLFLVTSPKDLTCFSLFQTSPTTLSLKTPPSQSWEWDDPSLYLLFSSRETFCVCRVLLLFIVCVCGWGKVGELFGNESKWENTVGQRNKGHCKETRKELCKEGQRNLIVLCIPGSLFHTLWLLL